MIEQGSRTAPAMQWLPQRADWPTRIRLAEREPTLDWPAMVHLAQDRLDFLQVDRLDRLLRKRFSTPPEGLPAAPLRLAVLGSATLSHLGPSIRIAALRRNAWLTVYEGAYAQYVQPLLAGDPELDAFKPDVVLLALDAQHVAGHLDGSAMAEERWLTSLHGCWAAARERFGATVIQQTIMPVLPSLLGSNEHRWAASPAAAIARLNVALRQAADQAGIHLLALDDRVSRDGLRAWHDPVMWLRSKHEVSPMAAPIYGDLVARLLGALQGRSSKCLVLDLDNTVWGGVIGDDGMDGIVLGQGSALGEAFCALQRYAKGLSRRGIILAVCSKNDEAVALAAFDNHPEMVLRRTDIASFVANWDDKAQNIRRIARELNIGLDSLVFVDDNPFERNLVREHLPEVAVPEIPDDDPAAVPQLLADAGYFESLAITADDRSRTAQYRDNEGRRRLEEEAVDLPSYLRSLQMTLGWRRFDRAGLPRIVQLVNKTNQFNLTTRRVTDQAVLAVLDDPKAFGLQLRLADRFGDNGMIAVVIGRLTPENDCLIDTWLMSCRVLGRGVEGATLNLVAAEAQRLGADRLVGEYRPTAKNGMVSEHYVKLGFEPDPHAPDRFVLHLADWRPLASGIDTVEGTP